MIYRYGMLCSESSFPYKFLVYSLPLNLEIFGVIDNISYSFPSTLSESL